MLCIMALYGSVSAQRTLHKVYAETSGISTGIRGDIATLENGNPVVLIERYTNFSRKGFQLLVLDQDLEIIDSASFFGDYTYNNLKVLSKNDTVYVAGNVDNEASSNVFFASFTKDLSLITSKVLESNLNYYVYHFMIHPQGGFAGVGYIIGPVGGSGGSAIGNVGNMTIRFDEKGDIIWCKRLSYASASFGNGNVLPNGDIIASGGSKFWCIGASGNLKWADNVDNFDLIHSQQSIGSTVFFVPTNYQLDLKQVLRIKSDGSFIGVTQGIKIGQPQFSEVIGQNLVVGSSYFTTDSVFLQLHYIGTDGKVLKQTQLSNYFNFAATGSIRDACRYSMHVTKSGIPYVLAVAERQGFGIYKLDASGDLGCMKLGGESGPGPQGEPGLVINDITLTEHQTGFQNYLLQSELPSTYSNEVICDNCVPINYTLPPDTSICEGQTLTIELPDNLVKIEWNDGSSSKTKTISSEGQYICSLYSTCDTLIDTLNVTVIKVDPVKISYSPEAPLPGDLISFLSAPGNFMNIEWYLYDNLIASGVQWNYTFEKNGKHKVKLRAYNQHCYKEDSVIVKVLLVDWYLPNSFTPNNDDRNEVWGPVGTGLSNYELVVYTRWGELVYQGSGYWDGRYKESLVNDGIYLYYLQGLDDDGEKVQRRGTITLLH